MVKRILLVVLIVVLLGSMVDGDAAMAKSTKVSWSPERIQLQLFPGTCSVANASFMADGDLTNVTLWIVPELDDDGDDANDGDDQVFITVEPQFLESVSAGVPYSVTLLVSVPPNTDLETYEGTLHIKIGKRTIAQTLKIILNINEANSTQIPINTVSLPVVDRIYEDTETGAAYVKDEVLIGFQEGTPEHIVHEIVTGVGGVFLGSIVELDLYQVQIPTILNANELEEVIQQLEARPEVTIATHSWVNEVRKKPDEGNDPQWDSWEEETPGGNNWAHELIKLPSAWDYTTGNSAVSIGVVDIGFDIYHEDLRDNVEPSIPTPPLHEHGTGVLGVIGAKGNNEVGISGVMWDVTLLPYSARVPLTEIGMLFAYSIYKMWLAINDGAKIINYSGGKDYSSLWLTERQNDAWRFFLDRVEDKEILFIFAAGQTDTDDKSSSPSSLSTECDNVISVTASAWLVDELSAQCNYGEVSVAAPGERIYTTVPNDNYHMVGGTSFAAPFVTGLAGLIWSVNPNLTAAEVKQIIVSGAWAGDRKVAGHNFYVIDAHESVALAKASTSLDTHLLAVMSSEFDSIADLPDQAVIATPSNGTYFQWLQTALGTYGKSFRPVVMPTPYWIKALRWGLVDAALVTHHPAPYLKDAIDSGEVRLLCWGAKAVESVASKYPEATMARLPADTYWDQAETIGGYAPAEIAPPPGSVSGHVYESDGSTPVEGAMVGVFDYSFSYNYGWVATAADGSYVFSGLATGQYAVRVEANGYAVEWYEAVIDKREATPVWVAAPDDTSSIDFTIEPGASILGHVYDSDGTTPIEGAWINVYYYASLWDTPISYETAWTSVDGSYKTSGLPTGIYAVRASAYNYVGEWYDNVYRATEATPVPVTVPHDTFGIDFRLEPSP